MNKNILKFSKHLPYRHITLRFGVNIQVLQKLISLNNYFVHCFNISYDESSIECTDGKIIYFESTSIAMASHPNLQQINKLIRDCMEINSISKADMAKANELWKLLLEEAKKST